MFESKINLLNINFVMLSCKSRENTRLRRFPFCASFAVLWIFELAADALVQFDPSTCNCVTASHRWQLFRCQAAGDHHLSWHAPSTSSPRCSDWKAINNHYDRRFWLHSHPSGLSAH